LREICRNIAADEIRHYKLFYRNLTRYLVRERVGAWRRLRVAVGRIVEAGDDELAYAYYAANEPVIPYARRHHGRAYARRALALYRQDHVQHMVVMVFKTVGLAPRGRLAGAASRLAWRVMRFRATRTAA
jgi:hypothetical protein